MIETARLRIVPFAEQHLTDRYIGWLNDPEVVRYSDQRLRAHDRESCRAYLVSFVGSPNYFWALIGRDPALGHIGTMTAYVDRHHGLADIGILIGERACWRGGFGTEAWIAVCDYLFRAERLRKITAGTIAPNEAMLGIMRRVGMVEDGRRARHHLFEGRPVDVIHAALFAEEWRPGPGAPSG